MHACLAVTCHLQFWQNDRDLSHATAVTGGGVAGGGGGKKYRNKSLQRKVTLEKSAEKKVTLVELTEKGDPSGVSRER